MNRALRAAARYSGRLTSLVLGCVAAQAVSAAGWDQTLRSDGTVAAQVVDVAAVNGARWLLVQRGDFAVLQRQAGSQITVATKTALTSRLIAMPDGGALLAETTSNRVRRFDAQGQFVWQRDVTPLLVLTDSAGGSWIETVDNLQRIAADGSLRATLTPTVFPVVARTVGEEASPIRFQRPQRAIDAQNGDLLIAGRSSTTPNQGSAQLARFDRAGRQRWSWTDPTSQLEFTAVATNYGFSCAAARQTAAGSVTRLCVDDNGQLRWQAAQTLGPNSAVAVISLAQDGSVYSLETVNRTNAQLTRVSASGAVLWTKPLPAGIGDACTAPGTGCSLHVALNGSATVLTTVVSGASQRLRLIGFNAAGTLNYDRELPVTTVVALTREANGHVLLVGAREAGLRRLVEIDAAGNVLVEDTQLSTPQQTRARAVAGNAQGDTFVVSRADGASSYRVRRVTANGTLAWDVEYPGEFDLAQATATNDLVCISEVQELRGEPNNRVRCLAVNDGHSLWSRTIEEPVNFRSRVPLPATTFRLRDDNHLALSYLYNGLQLFDEHGGSEINVPTAERTPAGDFNKDGDSVVVERLATTPSTSNEGKLIRYNKTGRLVYEIDLAAAGMQPQQVRIDDEDNVYVVGRETQASAAAFTWMIDPNGAVRWKRALEDLPGATPFIYLADDSVVIERRAGTPLVNARVALEIIRREAGVRRWRKIVSADAADYDASTRSMVVFGAGDGRWDLASYSIENGIELASTTIACAADDCAFGGVAARSGIGRVAGADRAAARTFDSPAAIRVDQLGLNGAWGSYYGEGEGLVLDWLPQARLIFMPWFTYSTGGGNETAQQRWYVAQAANVPAGARSADIDIYYVTGGAFDSSEPRMTTKVGSGTLRFTDCANGTFSYVFDPRYNEGAAGTITLSRLSPATQSCILADGSVQPAPEARPASKGFDARQSGSWYEPATGGQGMQLTVQPDGVFFGAWFAYDVAGSSDDNGRQHWFTLQGNLATAVNGKVDLIIVQTVGGAFDRRATRNRYIAGQATLQMHGCDRATLTYRFGNDERVGAFAGKSGELEMIKEGGCGP
jgi:hypothetical protein